jgi:hypothetical protein
MNPTWSAWHASRRIISSDEMRYHYERSIVVASSRTPLAKSFRGSFNLTRPDDQAAHCIRDESCSAGR